MASTAAPLVARSTDGSLVGIHPRHSTLVRCYDGNVSNGSLKFTLRLPTSSPTSTEVAAADDGEGEGGGTKDEAVRKLVFASSTCGSDGSDSPTHLCGMKSTTILVWDLDRGVLAHTIDVRAPPRKKKKKRPSSIGGGTEVVCDVAAGHGQLYVLVFLPSNDEGHAGKCRIYQYDLSTADVALKRKIKVGSVPIAEANDGAAPPLFGLAVSKNTVAVRLGTQLRILDASSGEKLCKLDLPTDAPPAAQSEGNESFVPLATTSDGAYLAVGTHHRAVVLSHKTDDVGGGRHALRPLALLAATDDPPIEGLDLTLDDVDHIDLSVVAFQPTVGVASLYAVATSHAPAAPLVPQLPQATMRTAEDDRSLTFVDAGFHPRHPNEALRLLFQRGSSKSGSAAGGGTILPMEVLKYADDDDGLDGTVVVGTTLVEEDDAKKREGRKRKAASGVALAPGEMGREASGAVDLTSKKTKKARAEDEEGEDEAVDEEEFAVDDDEEGEPGQSIAERLALLSSAMEQTDEEDDDDDDEEGSQPTDGRPTKFKLKSATSETLTTLLSQALTSNDAQQLHVALQVTDRRLVESTVAALQALDAQRRDGEDDVGPALLPALLAHIVRRMARRHSLVLPLGAWVRAILAATARGTLGRASAGGGGGPGAEERMAREGREMAAKLGPLRNLLNERVECFPQLLRLEGRLALLNQQL